MRPFDLLPVRKGHFRYESGHHSDTWIDLERLCLRPEPVTKLAHELADRLKPYAIEAVCGPLVEGAFIALMVASRLQTTFTYAERFDGQKVDTLYPVTYRIPQTLRDELRGRRVAIVNDVISAGSAVRGTLSDLIECGAETAVVASLAVLGNAFVEFAAANHIPLESLIRLPNNLWPPGECPMCADGKPLTQ
ncbi:MAG TPA: phosphoribosyltransferase family protein [Thermoanaerobaculia bacterium]|nr:phosphoribosyltransferase family protein [Thermoanaerobaculia bacterium]